MKKTTITLAFLMITSIAFGQMADIKNAITQKEKNMYESIKNGDMNAFKNSLSENFMGVYASGISNRDEEVETVGSNLAIDSYSFSEVSVLTPADNVAVINYKVSMSGSWADEAFSNDYYATSTWIKMGNEWKVIVHSDMQAESMEEEMEEE